MHLHVGKGPAAQDRDTNVGGAGLGGRERHMHSKNRGKLFSNTCLRSPTPTDFLQQKYIGYASRSFLELIRDSVAITVVCEIDRHHARGARRTRFSLEGRSEGATKEQKETVRSHASEWSTRS
jgi:hypothetical protein